MGRLGVYFYCFARAGVSSAIRMMGVGGRNRVTALETKDVAAVFSQVPLDEFEGHSAKTGAQDPDWVIARACQHERVVENVMRRSPVLPVRFGCVFSSKQALMRRLTDEADGVARFLDKVSGKEEWSVKGFVDVTKAGAWLLTTDPVLAERRAGMPESPGARYFHQKRLDAEVQSRLQRWRLLAADQVYAELRKGAGDTCPLTLKPLAGKATATEMVLNCAFLLARDSVADFRRRVARLEAERSAQGLTLAVSGPWPPYNFCPTMKAPSE